MASGSFDVVLCADNSLAHMLTSSEVDAALPEMRRVLTEQGTLLLSLRDYDTLLNARPESTPVTVTPTRQGRAVTFQLWHWHDDAEHYDLEHFQLIPDGTEWTVRHYRVASWALSRARIEEFVTGAGFNRLRWHEPRDSGFFQPVLSARTV